MFKKLSTMLSETNSDSITVNYNASVAAATELS